MKVEVKKLSPRAYLPEYATDGSGCFDLFCINHVCLSENTTVELNTGLVIAVPEGHVMLIYSRSGHGFKYGARLANCVGVIDSDYRGEIKIKLRMDADDRFHTDYLDIRPGDAVAQAMIIPIPKVEFEEVEELSETDRGSGGFGSTGR